MSYLQDVRSSELKHNPVKFSLNHDVFHLQPTAKTGLICPWLWTADSPNKGNAGLSVSSFYKLKKKDFCQQGIVNHKITRNLEGKKNDAEGSAFDIM